MYLFAAFTGWHRRYLCNESGSAHIEWIIAVALVVVTAIPIMSMIGRGSEIQTGEIAFSISDVELPIVAGTREEPAPGPVADRLSDGDASATETASLGVGPGAHLGIGYSPGVDVRAGDYRPIRTIRAEHLDSMLDDLRRNKPVPQATNFVRTAPAAPPAPEKAGVLLPRLPLTPVGFAPQVCFGTIDENSIADARFDVIQVVSSGG